MALLPVAHLKHEMLKHCGTVSHQHYLINTSNPTNTGRTTPGINTIAVELLCPVVLLGGGSGILIPQARAVCCY